MSARERGLKQMYDEERAQGGLGEAVLFARYHNLILEFGVISR